MKQILISILLIAMPLLAQQPQNHAKSSNQITATRTVKIFTDLEHQLAMALHSRDQAALDRLLAPDFEVRRSSSPGVPVARAEFIGEKHPEDIKLAWMAVRLVGSTAIVSFLADEETSSHFFDQSSSHFIVDTWLQDGSAWKLVARYQSPASREKQSGDKPTGRQ